MVLGRKQLIHFFILMFINDHTSQFSYIAARLINQIVKSLQMIFPRDLEGVSFVDTEIARGVLDVFVSKKELGGA